MAAFEAVGSSIVIALLIVPAATAHLLTDRLGWMLGLSALIGVGGTSLGHVLSIVVPPWFGFEGTSSAGMMAVALGLCFMIALVCGPRHGWLGAWLNRRYTRAVEPGAGLRQ